MSRPGLRPSERLFLTDRKNLPRENWESARNSGTVPKTSEKCLLDMVREFMRQGQLIKAQVAIKEALNSFPNSSQLWNLHGELQAKSGTHWAARQCFERAIRLDPRHPEPYLNQGELSEAVGDLFKAFLHFQEARAVAPEFGPVYWYLARLAGSKGNLASAISTLREGVRICNKPFRVKLALELASFYEHLEHFEDAERTLRGILAECQSGRGYLQLGNVILKQRNWTEARDLYIKAVKLHPNPEKLPARINLENTKLFLCQWDERERAVHDLKDKLIPRCKTTPQVSATCFELAGLYASPAEQRVLSEKRALKLRRRWYTGYSRLTNRQSRYLFSHRRRIRGGYLSGDVREHPVGYLLAGIIEQHASESFDVAVFSTGSRIESIPRSRIRASTGEFYELGSLPSSKILQTIRRANVDILVDLGGYSISGRPEVLAARAAPLQVSFLGYAGTLGTGITDYIIADRNVIPECERRFYAENIVYLENGFFPIIPNTAQPVDAPVDRSAFGLPPSGVVFCTFHANYKIDPTVFDVWMRLLQVVPESVLWLKLSPSEAIDSLKEEAVRRGVASQRLILADRVESWALHIARMSLADIFLDTFIYSAHATAIDALAAGLPLIAHPGNDFPSRVSASILKSLELPFLIATSTKDYHQLAYRLAIAQQERRSTRRLVRQAFNKATEDRGRGYTRALERAFRAMTERSRKGLSSRGFAVTSN